MSAKTERNAAILFYKKQGWTLQMIADEFGISRERVRQLTVEGRKDKARQNKRRDISDVFYAIEKFFEKNKYPPTIRELCEVLDNKSTSHVSSMVDRLVEHGRIKRIKGISRGIILNVE